MTKRHDWRDYRRHRGQDKGSGGEKNRTCARADAFMGRHYVVDVEEVPRFPTLESMAKWLNGFGIGATIAGGSLFVYGICVAGTGVGAGPGGAAAAVGGGIGTIGGLSMGIAELIRWLNGTKEVEVGKPRWELVERKPYYKDGFLHQPE